MDRTRLLLAEDHKEMCDKAVRELEVEFDVVGTVGDGQAMLEAESLTRPDVCVMDISMPQMSGIEAATILKQRGSTAKIVFLTVHEDQAFVDAALASGASAYVVKPRMMQDLRLAIREVLAGRVFISPPSRPF
ncbi:MAG TPA: response regulator transcription factor [Blastocatellia bacterium]|nr:response regulator transcription factor [Blastocatellia bacterium]